MGNGAEWFGEVQYGNVYLDVKVAIICEPLEDYQYLGLSWGVLH